MPDRADRERGARRVRPVGLVEVAAAMAAVGITTTALGVVARSVADDLDVDAAALGWAVNAYLLVAASFALLGGRLGDRVGRRVTFGWGSAVFATGSVVAAVAPGLPLLVAGRVLQGVGAALLLPASIEVIALRRGPDEHRALLVRGTAFAVAFGVGPLVGGLLGDTVGWRWVFVLVALLAAVPAVTALVGRGAPEPPGEPFHDPLGSVLSVVGVFAVVLLAERGRDWGVSWATLASGAVALVVLGLFVLLERHAARPLLRPSLLRDRVVFGGDLATFAASLGMLGLLYFFGIFARSAAVFDASGLQVAVALVPFTLSLALLGALAGRLVERVGRAVPVVVGMALMAGGFLALSLTTVDTTEVDLLVPLAICGIGAGLANACVTGPAVLSVEQLRLGEAAGVASLARFAGTALAVAIGTATYLNIGEHHVAPSASSGLGSAVEIAAATPGAPTAEELVVGGDAFERALSALDRDLQAPFRAAVELDVVDGFSSTMRWTGVVIGLAAVVCGWLLRGGPQGRQSSTGGRSRGPANGSSTGPPAPADS